MIDEIKNKYEHFSDSLVLKIVYDADDTSKKIEVIIKCMNKLNDYEFEIITLSFEDIISFCFIDTENQSNVSINAALLTNERGIITFDFSPLIFERAELKENENSDFKIKCRKISYKQMN
ncbi:MAG: hypothetical protein J0G96_03520 [Flavobacteriia bacterium]|nr:hypothetical protein [Flavobacteriia bacterium]OJX39287.1 MAG: hypothetical protein BGO87_04710 [Flavobacteriia bacterium 40-80]